MRDPILEKASYPPINPIVTSCSFSNDGKWLLLGTSGSVHYVLDSYKLDLQYRLEGHTGLERLGAPATEGITPPRPGASGGEVSWTPDSRFVVCGSLDGKLFIWDVHPPEGDESLLMRQPAGPETTLGPIRALDGHGGKPSRVVAFNPKYGMMASGGNELVFWLPEASRNQTVFG